MVIRQLNKFVAWVIDVQISNVQISNRKHIGKSAHLKSAYLHIKTNPFKKIKAPWTCSGGLST
ncbi:hypothetical protein GCM10022210_21730 [Mucilaginibacter dorajii]|uniref:Transposase n=1 Tax=Mucilaginibacter dorajii TaxID=692994 RepID=A0ABP7PVZ5_9SPHI